MSKHTLVICVANENYEASLELRKLYQVIPDDKAKMKNFLRVIDESGEDYLYPEEMFIAVDLPDAIEKKILQVA